MKDVIVITGPTAVGKTKLSIALAKKINGEIINADSMQLYKNLDIGTAKVSLSEMDGVVHHLFDICDVTDDYNVYMYQKDARKCIDDITSRGKVPILVGGTGLYIKAALYEYNFKEEEQTNNYDNFTNLELYQKVKEIDPDTDIHLNNRKRLIRACQKIDQNISLQNNKPVPLYNIICIGLTTNRKLLYQKIDERVIQMINDGLIAEVKYFYDKNIRSKALLTGIGYKELYKYFDKEISLDEVITLIQKNSRHYAKRQYTFFLHQFDITWLETNYEDFSKTIDEALNIINKKRG